MPNCVRAQVRREVLQNVPGQPRATVPGHHQRLQLRLAQFDERKFRRDEKAVGQDDGQYSKQPERAAWR